MEVQQRKMSKCATVAAERVLGGLRCSERVHVQPCRSWLRTQLGNAFVRLRSQPTPQDIEQIYRRLTDPLPELQDHTGASSPFEARIFKELVVAAHALTRR